MEKKWLDVLSGCPLFEGIEPGDLQSILGCLDARIVEYKKNDYLKIAGEELEHIGIVLSGVIALAKETSSGNRVIINLLEAGEIFGEMAAYSGQKKWPVTVSAHTDCTVMFFPAEKIVGCCNNICYCHPKMILNMLKIVSNRALLLNKKVEYHSLKTLRCKIATYLLEMYEKSGKSTFQLALNRNELAEFVNASRPSLSRELGKMRDEGLIDFFSSAIKIKNLEALKKLCE